jgi:tetratricopeptide (TPR) repeat protein
MKKLLLFSLIFTIMSSNAFAAYEQALTLFQEKKYQESLDILAEDLVVADDFKPGSPNYKIRFLAAHIHWKLGNEESASIHLRKCMAIEKTKVDPYIDLALLFMEKGRLNAAVSVVEDGLKIKEDPMLLWILGRIYYQKENYWRAKELLEKSVANDPELYFSYNDLGMALMKLSKFGDANTAFSVALAVNPDSAEINLNIAQSLISMGKFNDAEIYAKKANTLSPDNEMIKNIVKKIEENKSK